MDAAQVNDFQGTLPPNFWSDFRPFKWIKNEKRRCAVDAWNTAAEASTGQILIGIADDYHPPEHWDTKIIDFLLLRNVNHQDEWMLQVDNQDKSPFLLAFNFMSRAYYKRLGYFYWPEYSGLCNDNDISEVCRRDGVLLDARAYLKFQHKQTGTAENDPIYKQQLGFYESGRKIFERRRREGFPPLKRT